MFWITRKFEYLLTSYDFEIGILDIPLDCVATEIDFGYQPDIQLFMNNAHT